MIELTPLDVRKKKGDFRRGLRGYDAAQVDDFLDIVADRMEVLVREAMSIRDRVAKLEQEVTEFRDREKALTEALVTAQQMRETMRNQSSREVEVIRSKAEQEVAQLKADAMKSREREEEGFRLLRVRQGQFLASYKAFLEHELSDLATMVRSLEEWARTGTSPVGGPAVPDGAATANQAAATAAAGPVDPPGPGAPRAAAAAPPASTRPNPPDAPKPDGAKPGRSRKGDDELDAQLAQALARWEPELEENKATPVEMTLLPETDLDADELELLLDDDDVVVVEAPEPKAKAPRPPLIQDLIPDDEEMDAELAELLGPQPVRASRPAAAVEPPKRGSPPTPPRRDLNGDANAAIGDATGSSSYIDLDEAFGEAPPEPLRTPPENPLAEVDGVFGQAEDTGDDDPARTRSSGASVIDLENYGALENYGPVANATPDAPGLTLHPMFFDKDSTEIPGLIRPPEEKKRPNENRWAGGDK